MFVCVCAKWVAQMNTRVDVYTYTQIFVLFLYTVVK